MRRTHRLYHYSLDLSFSLKISVKIPFHALPQESSLGIFGKLLSKAVFLVIHIKPLQRNGQGVQTSCCKYSSAQCTSTVHSWRHAPAQRHLLVAAWCEGKLFFITDPMHVALLSFIRFTDNICFLLLVQCFVLFMRMIYIIYIAFILFMLYFILVVTEILVCVHCLTAQQILWFQQ